MTVKRSVRLALILIPIFLTTFSTASAQGSASPAVNPIVIMPFILLLLSIALIPFISRRWWQKYYPVVSVSLAAITAIYYLFPHHNSDKLVQTISEFFSFIILIGSIYIVSGGITISITGQATPWKNVLFLITGALLANFLGTMGASVLLIRPFLKYNQSRVRSFHVVFFIFIISNIGGALSPIGNPPIFLGYLLGVPPFWAFVENWPLWITTLGILLLLFYAFDKIDYQRVIKTEKPRPDITHDRISINGLYNMVFMAVILSAIFVQYPLFLREILMVSAAIGSYFCTKATFYKTNEFSLNPIKEIAILFMGIFITMVPALEWVEYHSQSLGISSPGQFYWLTGFCSSVLDNAPTYLNFLSAAIGLNINEQTIIQIQNLVTHSGSVISASPGAFPEHVKNTLDVLVRYYNTQVSTGTVSSGTIKLAHLLGNNANTLKAVSIGAVFFGAGTYIGNVPNFMVKSITEHSGFKTPTFIGYILCFSIPILLPVFTIIWWIWFR